MFYKYCFFLILIDSVVDQILTQASAILKKNASVHLINLKINTIYIHILVYACSFDIETYCVSDFFK